MVICHGFTDSGDSTWMNPLKDLLLQQVSWLGKHFLAMIGKSYKMSAELEYQPTMS